ncbi:MAG: hypothetical protein HFF39_08250 [Lawsonibacter sp.]|nr:hypothetical protein [Lawsonibacter sp.]
MELFIENGDYVPDGLGGLTGLTGAQEVLQRVLFRLKARRGAMPFLPNLGSSLHTLGREKPAARPALARRYVMQALEDEDVEVTGVELAEEQDGRFSLAVHLLWQGEALTARTGAL